MGFDFVRSVPKRERERERVDTTRLHVEAVGLKIVAAIWAQVFVAAFVAVEHFAVR